VAVLKPRERLVYFRITEDEFHQFSNVCEQEGARSISDLARSAVQRLISECSREHEAAGLAPKMECLEKMIGEVTAQLEMLAALKTQGVVQRDSANGVSQGPATTNGPKAADHVWRKEERNGNPS
jgi:DNA-binding transcriptional regulator GbsR (MarR family)